MDVVTSLNCAALLAFWSAGLQSCRRTSADLSNMSALPPRGHSVCTADLFREAALCAARFHREAGANIQWFISFACLRTSSQWKRSDFSHNDATPSQPWGRCCECHPSSALRHSCEPPPPLRRGKHYKANGGGQGAAWRGCLWLLPCWRFTLKRWSAAGHSGWAALKKAAWDTAATKPVLGPHGWISRT